MTPGDRKYAKSHEWVKVDGDTAVVGITDHAQDALGAVTFIEMPKVGRAVKAGESCCVIESVKAASEIYAPVGGRVSAVNEALGESPETVNESPYEKGWIFRISGFDGKELDGLMNAAGYEASLSD